MFDLSGKTAIVTGASGGIGSAIARTLHANGVTVALSDMRVEPLRELADELGERAYVTPCNLSDAEGPAEVVRLAEQAMGSVNILINNAGLTRDGLSMRMKDEDWQSVIDVNLTACFRMSRACLRGMMKARWGRIINMSSIVGATGNAGQVNYAASKAGLVGMSKAMAQEVASRGITINCIAPGFIVTPMTDALTDEQKKALIIRIPAAQMGEIEDISAAVVYLASDEARYMTGQTLHINGGMAMV